MEQETISFCKYYKKLLVEDFLFNESRVKLHYGKCSVIGLCIFDQNIYHLGNIRITSLTQDAQLADDSYRVLLFIHLCNEPPPIDKFVEIFGEAVLYDTLISFKDEISSSVCINSKDLLRMRSEQEKSGLSVIDFDLATMQRYRPAIKVHHIVVIENAHELINYNLRLKKIIDES